MENREPGAVPDPLRRFPPQKIVVPVDFSEASQAALDVAVSLGRRWQSQLSLIHINELPPPSPFGGTYETRGLGEEDRHYHVLLARAQAMAADYPAISVRVEDGYAMSALSTLAESGSADLIVMGTHGREGLPRFILGSNAESVVHAARSPVLTVHAKPAAEWPRRILVPMKLSDYADKALLYALALADSVKAKISMLCVCENVSEEEASFGLLAEHLPSLLGKERYAELGRIIAVGRPAEAVLRAVEREEFDLVVLAAHKKPFWESLVLGTTAERVLRHCRVPVLSIPSIEAAALRTEKKESPGVAVWK